MEKNKVGNQKYINIHLLSLLKSPVNLHKYLNTTKLLFSANSGWFDLKQAKEVPFLDFHNLLRIF